MYELSVSTKYKTYNFDHKLELYDRFHTIYISYFYITEEHQYLQNNHNIHKKSIRICRINKLFLQSTKQY